MDVRENQRSQWGFWLTLRSVEGIYQPPAPHLCSGKRSRFNSFYAVRINLCSWANKAFQRFGKWLPPNQMPPCVLRISLKRLGAIWYLRPIDLNFYCRASNTEMIVSVPYLSSVLQSLFNKFPCLNVLTFSSSLDLSD